MQKFAFQKTLYREHMLIMTLKEKKLLEPFTKKNCKKQIEKRKGDKLYVNWKGYDSSFDSWIHKESEYK